MVCPNRMRRDDTKDKLEKKKTCGGSHSTWMIRWRNGRRSLAARHLRELMSSPDPLWYPSMANAHHSPPAGSRKHWQSQKKKKREEE